MEDSLFFFARATGDPHPTYLPMGAPEGTGISSNLVLELLHGLGAQWSPVGEGVPEMTRLEKIPWEGEVTLRSDS